MFQENRLSCWVLLLFVATVRTALISRFPINMRHKTAFRIIYSRGNNESDLPECTEMEVCNRIETYTSPWIERQCRCPGKQVCPMSTNAKDGFTVVDKSRQFKLCESTSILPTCRYFKDVTWTVSVYPGNRTIQTVHCMCPKGSSGYIFKHEVYNTPEGVAITYFLACSPQSKMQCRRKEPCRLFTVKKRLDVEEVTRNTLCECSDGHQCPQHHTDPTVMKGTAPISFTEDNARTYNAFCTSERSTL